MSTVHIGVSMLYAAGWVAGSVWLMVVLSEHEDKTGRILLSPLALIGGAFWPLYAAAAPIVLLARAFSR